MSRVNYIQCDVCLKPIKQPIIRNNRFRMVIMDEDTNKKIGKCDICEMCYKKIRAQIRKENENESKKSL